MINLLLLVPTLFAGYVLGRVVARRAVSRVWSAALHLTGAVIVLCGIVEAEEDRGFLVVAMGGLGLLVAGVVSSFRKRKATRANSVDLWAAQPHE